MCEALGQPQQAAHTLHEAAVAARQAGHLTHAMAAAHELTSIHSVASASHPASPGLLPNAAVPSNGRTQKHTLLCTESRVEHHAHTSAAQVDM